LSKLICLFAHYNSQGLVDQSVLTYLDGLKMLKCEIVFISNSAVSNADQETLRRSHGVSSVLQRGNAGNDFGAWSHALRSDIVPEDTDFLLLLNDSVIGPLFPLEGIITKMQETEEVDVWGMSDFDSHKWHIQSYFILLRKKVFRSKVFQDIFSKNYDRMSKAEIILEGEIGLSVGLVEAGYKCRVLAPIHLVDYGYEEGSALNLNPTHFQWKRLVTDFGVPFIKKELILKNPENIDNVGELFYFIEANSDYPLASLENYLIRSYDQGNKRMSTPPITVVCHLYYPQTIYFFLLKLAYLKVYNAKFIFNLSSALQHDEHFKRILTASFPDSFFLYTTSQGRDIGAKLAGINCMLEAGLESELTLIIHDKLSPHTQMGSEWRNRLLRVIEEPGVAQMFSIFQKKAEVGMIGSAGSLKNEWNPDTEQFTCTSNSQIKEYLIRYEFTNTDFNFLAGTIFWIRTRILKRFFTKYSALDVRSELEKGNALDFNNGTNTHAWERLFSFMVRSQGYKLKEV